jgi:hypothetical protein
MIKELLPGDTLKYKWVSSGTAPSSASYMVLDWNESVVDSGTLTSSGSGHYYENYTVPTSEGYYVFKSTVTINTKEYKRSTRFRVIELETD